jgi:hypothetical protein
VLKAVGEDAGEAATELMKTITPAKIESWTHSGPMDWANESFAIAEQAQTKYCIRQGASCDQPAGKVTIDAAYVVASATIIREQLQKAGVRSTWGEWSGRRRRIRRRPCHILISAPLQALACRQFPSVTA